MVQMMGGGWALFPLHVTGGLPFSVGRMLNKSKRESTKVLFILGHTKMQGLVLKFQVSETYCRLSELQEFNNSGE